MRRIAKRYIIVDGYNFINADEQLKAALGAGLESARYALNALLSEYTSFSGERGIVVYDATNGTSIGRRMERYAGIEVVFTKRHETADAYIERLVHDLMQDKSNSVRVVTLDWAEQVVVFSQGAVRVSAKEWRREIDGMKTQLPQYDQRKLKQHDRHLGAHIDEKTMQKLLEMTKTRGNGG